jgi:hypothetical protein
MIIIEHCEFFENWACQVLPAMMNTECDAVGNVPEHLGRQESISALNQLYARVSSDSQQQKQSETVQREFIRTVAQNTRKCRNMCT